jgi:N-acetylglutamate synthase
MRLRAMHLVTEFRSLSVGDLELVRELLAETEGLAVRDADSIEGLERFLTRNPELSVAAFGNDVLVGFILCGHDGRRGYLHHLVVRPDYRGRGVARELVRICIRKLEALGIYKTHVDVFVSNQEAHAVWRKLGWTKRNDISRYSFIASGGPDA